MDQLPRDRDPLGMRVLHADAMGRQVLVTEAANTLVVSAIGEDGTIEYCREIALSDDVDDAELMHKRCIEIMLRKRRGASEHTH